MTDKRTTAGRAESAELAWNGRRNMNVLLTAILACDDPQTMTGEAALETLADLRKLARQIVETGRGEYPARVTGRG